MADRVVYGNTHSLNGWPMVDQGSCVWVKVPGTNPPVSLQIREGQPAKILGAFVADWNAYLEPVYDADSACWTATNSVGTSDHLSGTACDVRWQSHPFRVVDAGFSPAMLATMNEMLDFYEDIVWWGNRWRSPKDAMHVSMSGSAYGTKDTYGAQNVDRVQSFIDRKIRSDGFSTFRRGGTVTPPVATPPAASGLTAESLSRAMGGSVSIDRYTALLPAVRAALVQSGCAGNLNRLAMWLAQIGHESGGLKYMEEIASGAAYEGRADLGNTQPGDGVRFKGHGPIQITGRANHAAVSKWAYSKGYVTTPTFFVDDPKALASDRYGFLGAVWYWTVARSNINTMCDAGDLNGVTRAINGGTNGLDDRRTRWDRCRAMGLAALDVTGTTDAGDDDLSAEAERQISVIYQELTKRFASRSPLRHVGEGVVDTLAGFVLNIDGSQHVEIVTRLAKYGDPDALSLLREVAGNTEPGREHDAQLAQAILAEVTAPSTPVAAAAVSAAKPSVTYRDDSELMALRVENASLRAQLAAAPAPTAAVEAPTNATPGTAIGKLYDSLDELRLADALPIESRAPLAALISVLSTKNGAQLS